MTQPFIARGNGYAGDTTFDGYTVIAEPLPTRESRVLRCDYSSHSVKLAVRTEQADKPTDKRDHYILMQHGGGRIVASIRKMYDGGAFIDAVLAMPEVAQYGALYTLFEMADDAAIAAREAEQATWRKAFITGRIKKSRPKQGKVSVTIAPWYEGKADPTLDGLRASAAPFELKAGNWYGATPGWYVFREPTGPAYGPYASQAELDQASQRPSVIRATITLGSDGPATYL